MKYRKKQVVIEAFLYDGRNPNEDYPKWFWDEVYSEEISTYDNYCLIETLEGTIRAERGDWIIRGIKGELYPCKPDIFEMTYEKVDDSPNFHMHLGRYNSES